MSSSVPPEILHILNQEDGRFLLIKGAAGTGKTIFCLELIKECGGIYISTRVHAKRLYRDSPGLEDSIPEDFIIDAATEIEDHLLKEFVMGTVPVSKGKLKKSERDASKPLPPFIYKALEKIEYAEIPFVVVIDSWDAILSLTKYEGVRPMNSEEMESILINTFRGRNVNLIIVKEGEDTTSLDYVVDGVIVLKKEKVNDRIVRVMTLSKLRGTEIKTPELIFTLHNGIFRYFEPYSPKVPTRKNIWKSEKDSDKFFSSGSKDFDKFLGGGFPRGSTVLLELGPNVIDDAYEVLISQVTANFVSQKRGVLIVPYGGMDIDDFCAKTINNVGKKLLNTYVRIGEKVTSRKEKTPQYIFPLRYEKAEKDLSDWNYLIRSIRKKSGQPVLEIIGIDTQEARYGEEIYRQIISLSAEQTRSEGNLVIRITRPGMTKMSQICANVSDIHLKIIERYGTILIYKEKPRSRMYHYDIDTSLGNQKIKLTPIV